MTNEEKAREIAKYLNQPNGSNSLLECHQAAMAMAEWKEQQMIEKAVKWIKSQMIPYGASPLALFNYIEEFKQAMKEIKNES